MSKSVELPDDVYARVEQNASAAGNTVAEAIAERFPAPCRPPACNGAAEPPGALADSMEGSTGGMSSDGATDEPERLAQNGSVPGAGETGVAPMSVDGGEQRPRTLADEFAGRVGLIRSGRSDLSERVSELFAAGMVEKRRAGHL